MTEVTFRAVETLADFHGRELEWLEVMARRGSELAPAAALFYCARHKLPPPSWVIQLGSAGYCNALNASLARKRGRSSGPIERYRQDLIDYARWEEVKTCREKQTEFTEYVNELRSRPNIPKSHVEENERKLEWLGCTWLRAYECASERLSNTPAFGSSDAMKASYLRVNRNSKSRSLRYYLFDPHFLRSIGIEHPAFWTWGRKVKPLSNLTP